LIWREGFAATRAGNAINAIKNREWKRASEAKRVDFIGDYFLISKGAGAEVNGTIEANRVRESKSPGQVAAMRAIYRALTSAP
jgi:hypothetical protein